MSGGFIFGERGWVVECDPATRRPLPGGRVLWSMAVQFPLNGTTEMMTEESLPMARPEFLASGWIADETYRWRLVKQEAVTLLADDGSGRPGYEFDEGAFW